MVCGEKTDDAAGRAGAYAKNSIISDSSVRSGHFDINWPGVVFS